jgi:hypothetical protein
MVSTLALLRRLTTHGAEFVLVGGMAAIAHGSSAVTKDVVLELERVLAKTHT